MLVSIKTSHLYEPTLCNPVKFEPFKSLSHLSHWTKFKTDTLVKYRKISKKHLLQSIATLKLVVLVSLINCSSSDNSYCATRISFLFSSRSHLSNVLISSR